MLKTNLLISLESLTDAILYRLDQTKKLITYLWIRVHESNPVVLVTVIHPLKLTPMVTHDLLVVVRDEGLKDLCLLWMARIDLSEKCVD